MTYSVNQHWDPLNVCAVGKTYPPEFYNFIEDTKTRKFMEQIAYETEEDLALLIKKLETFGVFVVRTEIAEDFSTYKFGDKYLPAPLTPRDDTAMVGSKFFMPTPDARTKWNTIKGDNWPKDPPCNEYEWGSLSAPVKQELEEVFGIKLLIHLYDRDYSTLQPIQQLVTDNGNEIVYNQKIDSAMVCRIGKDLYFGTWKNTNQSELRQHVQLLFPEYRCHIINSCGHLDGAFCPVVPGLILSSSKLSQSVHNKHFPGWEVIYVDTFKSTNKTNKTFQKLKQKNRGRWWHPSKEIDDSLINYVQQYFDHWLGNVTETSIGVNILVVDENNILCIQENDKVFNTFQRYGITPHVVDFRHFGFWDSGLHCLTSDLHRPGPIKNYFPERD